ncbi:hypothetical protein B0T24DRAFT_421550 [Lasiosphaeria ovina]|uniref:Uncharacterized protein n=1 Tax=Lasiosphaeria ovina TaxID=92902 RepID=A0AAE0MZU3_9PEZI|nr:hypothetical protein B0T24DRAFT_421550 [Lasiosphaeria ovina]
MTGSTSFGFAPSCSQPQTPRIPTLLLASNSSKIQTCLGRSPHSTLKAERLTDWPNVVVRSLTVAPYVHQHGKTTQGRHKVEISLSNATNSNPSNPSNYNHHNNICGQATRFCRHAEMAAPRRAHAFGPQEWRCSSPCARARARARTRARGRESGLQPCVRRQPSQWEGVSLQQEDNQQEDNHRKTTGTRKTPRRMPLRRHHEL